MAAVNKHIYLKNLISYCFLFGVFFGFGGSFIEEKGIQHLMWAISAFFIIIAASLLGSKLAREEHDIPAAGFTILAIAQAMSYGFIATHDAGDEQFGAVIAIYVPGLILIGLYDLANLFLRIMGFLAAACFAFEAIVIFLDLNVAQLRPVLTYAGYIPFNTCILGWAWLVYKKKI